MFSLASKTKETEMVLNTYWVNGEANYVIYSKELKCLYEGTVSARSEWKVLLQLYEERYLDGLTPIWFEGSMDETALGEPQIWIPLLHGRYMEITKEDIPDEILFSYRVHCSDAEFDGNRFHSTCGIIDQCVEDGLFIAEAIEWAKRVAQFDVPLCEKEEA